VNTLLPFTPVALDRLDVLVAAFDEAVALLSEADAAFAIHVQQTALSKTAPAAAVALEALERASQAVSEAQHRASRLLDLIHRLEVRIEGVIGAAAPLRTPTP
jgi:hypothetical protein